MSPIRWLHASALLRPVATALRCPTLLVRGELDSIALAHWAQALARDTGGELVMIAAAGHVPGELRRFVERVVSRSGA